MINTLNWRIRKSPFPGDKFYFIEGDLPPDLVKNHFPKVEVMQEDFGDHNGYTDELRMNDAKLIISAPIMKSAITEILKLLDNNLVDIDYIKQRLTKSIDLIKD